MNMKKKLCVMALAAFLLAMLLPGIGIRKAYASDTLFTKEFTVNGKKTEKQTFTLKKKQVLYLSADFKLSSGKSGGEDGIYFAVYDDEDDTEILSDTFEIDKGGNAGSYWFYSDEEIDAGQYRLEIEGQTSKEIKGSVKVKEYSGYVKSIKKPEDVTVTVGKTKTIKMENIKPSGSLPNIVFKSSDGSIAEVYPDYGEGTFDVEGVAAGKVTVTAKLDNGKKYSFNVTVKKQATALNHKKFVLEAGYTDKVKLENATGKLKWKSTNKKVAKVNNKGLITAVSKGKCKVYTTYNGKKYTATVKVTAGIPWYKARLLKYDTKKNIFIVKIKNRNKKKLIIYPTKAKAVEDNSRSLDRDLELAGGKKVTIAPGKTVKLKFKVQGTVTYKNAAYFYVYYYMKYDGTKYYARTWTQGGAYKKGKKWYSGN